MLMITMLDLRIYPLFAFLFGYGMMQLLLRQTAAGTSERAAVALLRRRSLWLIADGTGLAGGLGYVAVFGLIAARMPQWARRHPAVVAVAAVGKRSLSSYLAHSLLVAPLLAAWGLGLGALWGSAPWPPSPSGSGW